MLFTPDNWLLERSPLWDEIQANRRLWLHRGVTAFAGYCRQQANKYGIKGSRVAASRAATEMFHELMERYGPQAKVRDHWDAVTALAGAHDHMMLFEDFPRDRPDCRVRMLEVCNRKVQEHVSLKEAHKVYQRLFDEYGQRALQAERSEGVDWKAMMHALRVCREAEELLLHHTISYPRPEAELLLRVRKGELPYRQVAEMLEDGLVLLEDCQRVSTLPSEPDRAAAEELVLAAYRRQIVGLDAA